jgi:hypothetical protein
MVIKTTLILMVILILMEDGSSIRKTIEEEKEDAEIAAAVNRTLAEEAEEKEEEEKKKKRLDQEKKKDEAEKKRGEKDKRKGDVNVKGKDQDEACPPLNSTCPTVDPCPEVQECPPCKECGSCPPIRCKPCPRCEDPEECPPVECPPVLPCPGDNTTSRDPVLPAPPSCPETSGMSVPVALAVGACAGGLLTGVAALLGLVIRYLSPIESGFVFLATFIIVWYLCSHHPETARELGGRAATILREAAAALSHRIVEAIWHHNDQVGLSNFLLILLSLSSMF